MAEAKTKPAMNGTGGASVPVWAVRVRPIALLAMAPLFILALPEAPLWLVLLAAALYCPALASAGWVALRMPKGSRSVSVQARAEKLYAVCMIGLAVPFSAMLLWADGWGLGLKIAAPTLVGTLAVIWLMRKLSQPARA